MYIGKKLSLPMCGQTKHMMNDKMTRIFDGQDAKQSAYPWIVALMKDDNYHCAGSIINNYWVDLIYLN